MKIGIVTYHRTNNYGAVMQALATRFVLEDMGHEVYYVDYWPDYHKEMYALFSKRKFKKSNIMGKAGLLLLLLLRHKASKRRIDNFEKFFHTYIYPYCRPVDESFDVVIYGSDQIWRKQGALGTYNPFYFGDNKIKTQHHISYAASMGVLPDNDADKEKVKALVSHLEKISVREEGLRQLLLSLGFENIALSVDPTFLLSSEEWNRRLPSEEYKGEKYALLYMVGLRAFDMKEVKKFTVSKGLKLIVLRGNATSIETKTNITSASPYEFISLIKNAEYVFTASFHGLAFSIIYGKQFFASFKRNSGRAESLLNLIGASNRLLPPMDSIPQDLEPIDYVDVHNKLNVVRQESLKYLSDIHI